MSLTIRPITSAQVWDEFVAACAPNTFLQSWAWGEFNASNGHTIHRLGVFDGETLAACALAFIVKARRGTFLLCPHGPVMREGADCSSILETLVLHLKLLAVESGCVFIRVCPLLLDTEEHRGWFARLGFRSAPLHMHPELAWILDVTIPEEDLMKQMRKTTRYLIRRAESDGVDIRMSKDPNDVETFWQLYQATVDRQHFTPFSKDYLRREFESFSRNDRVAWFFGSFQGDVISAAMIVFDSSSGYYHQGASIQKYPKIQASYLLQWRAIQEAKRRGCIRYNFWGISPDDRPKHPWAGLSLFKKGFGGYAEPYVHTQDLALQPRYWFSWALDTVRRLKRGL